MVEKLSFCPELLADSKANQSSAISFWESVLDAAFVRPASSIEQITARISGEEFRLKEKPPQTAAPYSAQWHAIQAGNAVGMLVPFAAVMLTRKCSTKLLARNSNPFFSSSVFQSAIDGAAFSALFSPAGNSQNFVEEKALASLSSAITFGGMAGAGNLLRVSKGERFDFLRHAGAGAIGGAIGAISHKLFGGSELPEKSELAQSMYTFAIFGAGARAAHVKVSQASITGKLNAIPTVSTASSDQIRCADPVNVGNRITRAKAPVRLELDYTLPFKATESYPASHERHVSRLSGGAQVEWNCMLPEKALLSDGLEARFSYKNGPFGHKTLERVDYSNGEYAALENGVWMNHVSSPSTYVSFTGKGYIQFSDGVYEHSVSRFEPSTSEINPYFFSTASGVCPLVRREITYHLQKLPVPYLKTLIDSGQRVRLEMFVVDSSPSLRTTQPPGYPAGSTYENVGGIYDTGAKQVVVAERMFTRYGMSDVPRRTDVLRHELGHALDFGSGRPSQQPAFMEQYNKDLAALPESHREPLKYYLQSGERGREEVFAQAANITTNPGKGFVQDQGLFVEGFPNSLNFVRAFVKQITEPKTPDVKTS